jgi:hypothetical protein
MIQEKDHSTSNYKMLWQIHCQSIMFNPLFHKVVHLFQISEVIMRPKGNLAKHFGALFMSPNENKPLQESFRHEHGKNFQHILELHTRPNCNVKVFEHLKEEMLHSCSHFHFAHVNIFSKHSCIPMLNNRM